MLFTILFILSREYLSYRDAAHIKPNLAQVRVDILLTAFFFKQRLNLINCNIYKLCLKYAHYFHKKRL